MSHPGASLPIEEQIMLLFISILFLVLVGAALLADHWVPQWWDAQLREHEEEMKQRDLEAKRRTHRGGKHA